MTDHVLHLIYKEMLLSYKTEKRRKCMRRSTESIQRALRHFKSELLCDDYAL